MEAGSLEPRLSGSPLDALVMRVHYAHGRLTTLADLLPTSGWAAAVTAPWRIGCLRATGHPEQALALYEDARIADWAHVWLHAMVGPEIMIDLGRADDSRAALRRGRELTRSSGSVVFEMLNELIEAKMEVRSTATRTPRSPCSTGSSPALPAASTASSPSRPTSGAGWPS